jgi:16S rRNA (cytosine967-C5)-methyltransferase
MQGQPASRPITPSRKAAFSILLEVAQTSAHSDDLLHSAELEGLSAADRALATTLVLGTLRWQIALDARVRPLLQRPDAVLALPVAIALRLGAFQMLHLDRIPAHAAISESVELTRAAGHPHAAGMVNAVLRKLSTAAAPGQPLYQSTAALAERLGHPAWMVERWVGQFGRAQAIAVCEHDQEEPPAPELFAPLTALGSGEGAEEAGEPSPVRLDDGSRLVAELAAAAHPGPQRIWDCCAAPGGKTLVLLSRHPEAELLATDVSQRRLRAMERRVREVAPRAKIRALVADAATLPAEEGLFDLILCDVPCSGTGTLARNPEIRHRLRPEDLDRQAARQRAILAGALQHLAPGGRLVYSTCSLEPEETEAVVEAVLGSLQGIAAVDLQTTLNELQRGGILTAAVESLREIVRGGRLRTVPGANFRGDGFFAAVLWRLAEESGAQV